MTAEDYRRLLGLILLWAVLPLSFLYIVLPPFWLAAGAVGLVLSVRPSVTFRMPTWALNLAGIAIIIAVLAAGGIRVGPLRPLGHLLLLLTAIRALMISDRRTFLRALLPTFLVWVVSVTSSTHVSVVIYIALSAVMWWWAGIRIQLAGLVGTVKPVANSLPKIRHAAVAALISLLLMVPFFLAIPRLRSPWLAGRGGTSSVTGFSSHVDLAGVGAIRQSHEVAVMVRSVKGLSLDGRWMRFRATALERVLTNSWAPRGAVNDPIERGGLIWPHGVRPSLDDTVELELKIMRPRRYLFQPEGTVALTSPVPVLFDPTGGIVLAHRVRDPLTYTVWVARTNGPRPTDEPPTGTPRFEMHPEVRRLADRMVAGATTDLERVEAVEDYLQQNFEYSMNGMTHLRADPVTWFLLEERAGHCEYFAGAMVAILADMGIPARMVAGYSGGDLLSGGDEAIVRESNAHTWVEVLVGEDGEWLPFDPTPEGEVPALIRPTGRDWIRISWDWVETGWDRYVLTFGIGEQMQLLTSAVGGIDVLTRSFSWRRLAWGAVALLVVIAGVWWLHGRVRFGRRYRYSGPPAAKAVQRLAHRLEADGIPVPQRATVRWIARRATDRWPSAGPVVRELAFRAERELYAAQTTTGDDRIVVRQLWASAARAMSRRHSV
jgi:hypothetical protein